MRSVGQRLFVEFFVLILDFYRSFFVCAIGKYLPLRCFEMSFLWSHSDRKWKVKRTLTSESITQEKDNLTRAVCPFFLSSLHCETNMLKDRE